MTSGEAAKTGLGRREWLILGLLTLAAAVFRLIGLGAESLWFDELYTWRYATLESLRDVIVIGCAQDYHPPGFQLFMHFWLKIFGESEFALRLPAAIAGILIVPSTFLVGRKLVGTSVGVYAAVLAATMPELWYYSREARAYSIMTLLTVVAVNLGIDCYRSFFQGERLPVWRLSAFLICLAALEYTHYYGTLMAGLISLFFIGAAFKHRRAYGMAFLPGLACLLAFIPWFSGLMTHLGVQGGWIPQMGFIPSVTSFIQIHTSNGILPTLALLALAVLGTASLWKPAEGERENRERTGASMLLAWLLVPAILVIAKSQLSSPIYWPRYLIIVSPAFFLLCGIGLSKVSWPRVTKLAGLAAIVVVAWIQNTMSLGYLTKPQKEDWRGLSQEIVERTPRGANASVLVLTEKAGVSDYYFARAGREKAELEVTPPDDLLAGLKSLATTEPRFLWVMVAHTSGEGAKQIEHAMSAAGQIGVNTRVVQKGPLGAILFRVRDWTKIVEAQSLPLATSGPAPPPRPDPSTSPLFDPSAG